MKKGSVGVGILLVVLLAALAVGLLLAGNWLYNLEVDWLDIEQRSGLGKELILRNYSAVTSYLSPFHSGDFEMPDLAWSVSGAQHFREVKAIVLGLYGAGLAAFLVGCAIFIFFRKKIGSRTFLSAAVSSFSLPLLVVGAVAIDYDGFFVLFHKIFFNNDYWIFKAATDPVITILPAGYFMHCALFIALFWVIGSAVFLVLFLRQRRKTRNRSKAENEHRATKGG